MKVEWFPSMEGIIERFPNQHSIKGFFGGNILAAEKDGKFYIIEDESLMGFLLGPEDDDLRGSLVRVKEFESEEERQQFLIKKGWH